MKAKLHVIGEIGKDVFLTDLVREYKSYESPTSASLVLNTIGGGVREGEKMYDFLAALDIPITTDIQKAYSIGSKLATIGEVRIVEDIPKAMMLHFPWAKVQGGSEKLKAAAENLEEIEDEFAEFYGAVTGLDDTTIRNLLLTDTYLSGEEAVNMGFATALKEEVFAKAVLDNSSNLKKSNKMKNDKKSIIEAFAAMVNNVFKTEINAALSLQDSDGTNIDFPDLEAGDTPKEGDKAEVDGVAISDGVHIMPQFDNAKVTFSGGAVESVQDAEDAGADDGDGADDGAGAGGDDGGVQATEIKEVHAWSVNVTNATFAVGDVLMYEYEKESYPTSAGEWLLPDGRSAITDASGVIQIIKDAVSLADDGAGTDAGTGADDAADAQAMLVMAGTMKKFKDEVMASVAGVIKENGELNDKLVKVNALLESPEFIGGEQGSGAGKVDKVSIDFRKAKRV